MYMYKYDCKCMWLLYTHAKHRSNIQHHSQLVAINIADFPDIVAVLTKMDTKAHYTSYNQMYAGHAVLVLKGNIYVASYTNTVELPMDNKYIHSLIFEVIHLDISIIMFTIKNYCLMY